MNELMNQLFGLPETADFDDVGDCIADTVTDWESVTSATETRDGVTVNIAGSLAKNWRGELSRCVTATVTRNNEAPVTGRAFEV